MNVRYTADPVRFAHMTTPEVRGSFLVDGLFTEDAITLVYSDVDRAILGSAVPAQKTLLLESAPELRAETFCERRELGILNIGGAGTVTVETVNLTGQLKNITMRRIEEPGETVAIYYIGETTVANRETLIFDIKVVPEGATAPSEVRFKREFYTDT